VSAAARPALVCSDGSDRAEGAARCARALLRPPPEVVVHVPRRRGASAVLAEAHRRDASVIVVEAHGRAPSWPGSLTGALLRHSRIPVLVCLPAAAAAASPAREPILACYDGSGVARKALIAAGDLLAGRAAIVATFMPAVDDVAVLRTSLPWPASAETQERLAALDRQEAEGPAARALEGVRTAERAGFAARALELPALGASTEEEVAPWRRLLRAARDEAAACIVVGHRPSAVSTGSGMAVPTRSRWHATASDSGRPTSGAVAVSSTAR
jgi:nucleotide-binding universal stress UspA family protein